MLRTVRAGWFNTIMSRQYFVGGLNFVRAHKIDPSRPGRGSSGTPQAAEPEPGGVGASGRNSHECRGTPRAGHLQSHGADPIGGRDEAEHLASGAVCGGGQATIRDAAAGRPINGGQLPRFKSAALPPVAVVLTVRV